ncbi:hypothetical protein GWN90_03725 [candidate division KSB1 bacterium]|nr:hypothetical protein [candidate division KSB1 bacterium]
MVGNRVITKDDFVKRYKYWRTKTGHGFPDTYEFRWQVLDSYVDEQLLILEAERRGYDDDSEGQHERQRIEIQELLNIFNRNVLASHVEISDEELKQLFVRLNTKIKARHLYAPTQAQADSLYISLKNGASFEKLAKSVFEDPKLRDTGGLLGYFTVDEMEPGFEEAAFELEIGEVSEPVRTKHGYSIIRVDDRITKPLLTETEYAKHKHKLYDYWRRRKLKKAIQDFSDSASRRLNIKFNEPTVTELFEQFEKSQGKTASDETMIATLADNGFSKNELVHSKFGTWTVKTFQEKARFTSARQHKWIHTKNDFKEFISGLLIRDQILQKARVNNLHKQAEYLQIVNEKWNDYLYDRIIASLRDEMVVPEDSLRSHYNEDPTRFAFPPKINLREIVLRNRETADLVQMELKDGESFAELARTYSVRKWTAEKGGELGYLAPRDFGRWSQKVFSLEVGEQTGPLLIDSMFVFLECIAKVQSKIPSFEAARPQVEEAVRFVAWEDYLNSKITAIRNSLDNVIVYPRRLKTIRLNGAKHEKN